MSSPVIVPGFGADRAQEQTRTARILVVDDNLHNRLVAEAHLVTAGYEVVLAESGSEALERFDTGRFDLVLLDILMPVMDGFETCKHLRARSDGREVPIAFLTALSDLETHGRALQSGGDDLLTKPINRTELLMRVRSLLWTKQLKDDLRHTLEVIEAQREELDEAHRHKQEMTSLIVHDLKNPLTAILLETGYLERGLDLPERVRRATRSVRSAAEHMNRMVGNLLDIARSEDGALTPRRGEIDLSMLVAEIVGLLGRRAGERNQRIWMDIPPDLPMLHGDRDLIARMLENLLDNSIKYAPAGDRIRIEASLEGEEIEIRVRDSGPGVPEQDRERIFDRYARLEGDLDRAGHGLGLAFCRLAAEVHGGRIWVEQNPGGGSVFGVRLPLRDDQ